jgi:hypothetical protein
MVEHGTSYADALLLSARQFVGQTVDFVREMNPIQNLLYALIAESLLSPVGSTQYEVEILIHGVL